MATAVEALSTLLEADQYLRGLLAEEAVNTSSTSPVRCVQAELMPLLRTWLGGNLLSVQPSGSFAKGTAIRSGTDIDLFLSIAMLVREPMRTLHESLFNLLRESGYAPRRQNVSINVRVQGYSVDLVPAHRQNAFTEDHSLYLSKQDTWIKTNVADHIAYVRAAKRQDVTRILKLWRNQQGLDFPSFYLELVVIRVLAARWSPYLSANVSAVFEYLRDTFPHARYEDPANGNNVLSDSLTASEKRTISKAARLALAARRLRDVVR